jgi:platelet-activating factor acetylhydrolase
MHTEVKSRTLILSKDINRGKCEIFEPSLLVDFLSNNQGIVHHKVKGLDHSYPADLTYFISSEMVLIGELRNDERVFTINSLLCTLAKKFM